MDNAAVQIRDKRGLLSRSFKRHIRDKVDSLGFTCVSRRLVKKADELTFKSLVFGRFIHVLAVRTWECETTGFYIWMKSDLLLATEKNDCKQKWVNINRLGILHTKVTTYFI